MFDIFNNKRDKNNYKYSNCWEVNREVQLQEGNN